MCSFSASSLSKAFSPRMQTKRATAPRRLGMAQRPARSAQGPQDARLCGAPRRPMPYPLRFRSTTSNSPAASFGSVFFSWQRSCLSRKSRRQDCRMRFLFTFQCSATATLAASRCLTQRRDMRMMQVTTSARRRRPIFSGAE